MKSRAEYRILIIPLTWILNRGRQSRCLFKLLKITWTVLFADAWEQRAVVLIIQATWNYVHLENSISYCNKRIVLILIEWNDIGKDKILHWVTPSVSLLNWKIQ